MAARRGRTRKPRVPVSALIARGAGKTRKARPATVDRSGRVVAGITRAPGRRPFATRKARPAVRDERGQLVVRGPEEGTGNRGRR